MKNFSFERMWQVLRYDFESAPKREIRSFVTGIMICLMVITMLYLGGGVHLPHPISVIERNQTCVILNITFVLYLLVSISSIGEGLRTKHNRIAMLMLPATIGEKFVAQLIKHSIYPALLFCISVVTADILFNVFVLLLHPDHIYPGFLAPYFFEVLASSVFDFQVGYDGAVYTPPSVFWPTYLLVVAFAIFNYCFYMLGGLVFKRRPFVMVAVSQLVLSIASGVMLTIILPYVDQYLAAVLDVGREVVGYTFLILIVAAIIFEVWLTYHLFAHTTIIKNRKFGI